MSEKKTPPAINQTAIGDGNVQVAGDNNTVNVNQTFTQKISNIFFGDSAAQRTLKNRRAMLELVKNTWIKGVLEKSLYNEALIELGLEERPGAVDHPWDMQVQMPNQSNRTLPNGTSMMQVFDEMNSAMLILGEPGSGKTTMLLELARDYITRAEQDSTQPIPVVLNLSSWSSNQSIDDWLVNELNTKYNVPKKTAQDWAMNDDLFLLLDGLDEVKLEHREACVKAINAFRQKHGLTVPIAICSRIADYEALKAKLNLSGAVFLQPLSPQQIEAYFEQAGPDLDGVQLVLQNDKTLQELVKQPLMLSVMTLAYRGRPVDALEIEQNTTLEARRKYLFDTYIQQMFARVARTKSEPYTSEQTKHWLSWLAQKMIEHNQVPYLLENMQPTWLNLKQWSYRLINGLLGGLVGGLSVGLIGGLSFSLIFGLIGWLNDRFFPWMDEEVNGAWRLSVGFSLGLSDGLITGLFLGLIVGLFYGLILKPDKIEMVDNLIWDWKQGRKGLIIGLMLGGLVSGLIYALIISLGGLPVRILELMTFVICGGMIGAAIGSLIYGLTMRSISQTTYPWQRISLSIRNFFMALLLTGPISGLSGGVLFWLAFGLMNQPIIGFLLLVGGQIVGLIFGTISGLIFGGGAVIQHYTLRFLISFRNLLPFRLVPFLDYCAERIFLRKVGGGYIFVHRLLMEHFAAMEVEVDVSILEISE